MSEHLHSHAREIIGSGVSVIGALTANQEQIEWWLRVVGSGVAIAAGVLTIMSLLRGKKARSNAGGE